MPGMRPASTLASLAIGLATALVVTALVVAPFLTPAWVSFEQGRAESAAWTGFAPADLRTATDAILHDLVIGPPAFDVALDGTPVLKPAERSHMRDVRGVFTGFYVLALVAAGVLVVTAVASRGSATRRAEAWRSVRRGAIGLAVVIIVAGAVAAVAFDAAFEVFHRLFFAPGSYNFDPRTDRLVQLFPDAFWSETSLVVGGVILAVSLGVAWLGTRRLRAASGALVGETQPLAAQGAR